MLDKSKINNRINYTNESTTKINLDKALGIQKSNNNKLTLKD